MTDSLPAPLTPPDCNLRNLQWMKLNIGALLNSDFNLTLDDQAWRAGMTLWMKSWWQVPAGSLPADDSAIRALANFKGNLNSWRKKRDSILTGFVLCSDGRLYHPVVCFYVNEVLNGKAADRERQRMHRARVAKPANLLVTGENTSQVVNLNGTSSWLRHRDTGTDVEECHGDAVPDMNGVPLSVTVTSLGERSDVTVTSRPCHALDKDKDKSSSSSSRVRSTTPRVRYRGTASGQPSAAASLVRDYVSVVDGKRWCLGFHLDKIEQTVFEIAQIDPAKVPISSDLIVRWMAHGIHPIDICDAIKAKTCQQNYQIPDNLQAFSGYVMRQKHNRDMGKLPPLPPNPPWPPKHH